GAFTFGHPGYGGQFVHMDPESGIAITYLSNGLKNWHRRALRRLHAIAQRGVQQCSQN
uniref:Beta-lactamase domain-containing protein n=1 Tax=Caenorhabditis japonica TaxID=281687 RepID=A0A8R1EPD0_CAEJA